MLTEKNWLVHLASRCFKLHMMNNVVLELLYKEQVDQIKIRPKFIAPNPMQKLNTFLDSNIAHLTIPSQVNNLISYLLKQYCILILRNFPLLHLCLL